MNRAPIGEAPRWVLRCVLATWVGLPLVFLAWSGFFVGRFLLTGTEDPPPVSLRPILTVLHLAVLAALLRGYVARRPLDRLERGYYRTALWVCGIFGLATTWLLGFVVAMALLLHSLLVDRAVRPIDSLRS